MAMIPSKEKKNIIITFLVIFIAIILFSLLLWRMNNPHPTDYSIIRETVMAGENETIWLDYMPGPQDPPNYRVIVTFSAENIDIPDGIASFSWDFGDGSNGTGEVVTHEYPEEQRTYFVTLTVIDNDFREYRINFFVDIVHVW